MLNTLTLTNIILGELILVLLLGGGLLTFVLFRERRKHRRVLDAYHRLRQTLRTERTQSREQAETQPQSADDAVATYLANSKEAAQQRYQNITQSTVPRLAPEQPFNAKVAALRYLYIEAEARAHRKEQASGDAWVLLERQLYDIARWIVDQENSKPSRQRNNQVKLLQQRIEKLKGFEKLSRDLQRKLDLNQIKRDELEALQEQNRITIDKLRRINQVLSLSQSEPDRGTDSLRRELGEIMGDDAPTIIGADQRVAKIEHFSNDHQRLQRELTQGLREYNSEYPSARGPELESTIQRLEAELYRSERHINELKQQLQAPSSPQAGVTSAYVTANAGALAPEENPETAMEQIQETLRVIHTNMADSTSALNQAANERPGQSPYSLAEIQQLRNNNQRQRNLIVDLEGEMKHLRNAIPETEDSELKDQQIAELHRLERLVKECEHCILALESEVDMLYNQLMERQSTTPETSVSPESLEQLQGELEVMSERLEASRVASEQDALLRQFSLDSLHAESIEELARDLIRVLKKAELRAGFYIESRIGHAEYFPGKLFSEKDRATVRRTTLAAEVAYLNEGILFASNHMHLMLKYPPEEDEALSDSEKLLHNLLALASTRIENLERQQLAGKHNQLLEEWSVNAHNTLVNMEITYAYQTEETLRLMDNLADQLHRALKLMTTTDSTRAVVENALSECQHRIRHLLTNEESVDQGCVRLLEYLQHLPHKGR